MTAAGKPPRRTRGEIETLPSGSLRVRVYAGIDPVTNKRHYLTEVVPPGPKAAQEAEKLRTRFLSQVDEQRNPRTRATVNQLLDRYFELLALRVTAHNRRASATRLGRRSARRRGSPIRRVLPCRWPTTT